MKVSVLIWKMAPLALLLSAVAFGQLERLPTQPTLYLHDVLALGVVGWGAIQLLKHQSLVVKPNVQRWLPWGILLGFVIIGWVRAGIQGTLGMTAIATALRLFLYALATLIATKQLKTPPTVAHSLVVLATWLMTMWGILQYLLLPDTRFLHTFGWDDHYYRLIGPLFDPNFAGMVAIMALYTSHQLLKNTPSLRLPKALVWLLEIVPLAALAMTFSRSSWLAFLLTGVSRFFFTKFSRSDLPTAARWLLVALACYALLPRPTGEGVEVGRTSTITARTSLTTQLMADWSTTTWLIGNGLFNVRPNIDTLHTAALEGIPNTSRQPDNIFIQLIGSVGLVGLGILGYCFWRVRATWPPLPQETRWLLAAWFIHAQFANSIFQPHLFILMTSWWWLHQKPESQASSENSLSVQSRQ